MRQPVIFFGHGNPMNAIAPNPYADAWRAVGASLRKPAAVVMISAHWYVERTAVTSSPHPRTIHDFGGFPRELYDVRYPAPGAPAVAAQIAQLLQPVVPVALDAGWGLDHGAWSVLLHVFPDADVPVVQLSIDENLPPAMHFEIGRALAPLRDQNVLIAASGNIVHNLHAFAWGGHPAQPFDWALRFERTVRDRIQARDFRPLVEYEEIGRDALLSVPTPDHYLPLLYVLGAADRSDHVRFPVDGVDGGSVSMLTVALGTEKD